MALLKPAAILLYIAVTILTVRSAHGRITNIVQGSIFCLRDGKASPIKGAIANVEALITGNPPTVFRVSSSPTNSNGFYEVRFLSSRPLSGPTLQACKVVLHKSFLHGCNVPTDINGGKKGAPLIAFSPVKSSKQIFSVKPFFYTNK